MDNEKIIQLQIIEQEANQLDQQFQLVEQHLSEMQKLNESMSELEKTKEKKIFANIGKGIYIPAEITGKMLLVEVGNKNMVRKTISETKKIIEEQLGKLINAKTQISERIEELQMQMGLLIQEFNQKDR
jgi:prefoldin alpha subunit